MSLVIYDTSNFSDFPIGGQLTSVRNFLRYVAEERTDLVPLVILVGVTLDESEVGRFSVVRIGGADFSFFPVALAENDQNNTKGSLRLRYAKGLMKYLRKVGFPRKSIHYIHTPEAYGPVRLITCGKRYVFSHGSFLGMKDNLRFYKGGMIADAFQRYLCHVVKHADGIFALDKGTLDDYRDLGAKAYLANNSVTVRERIRRDTNPGQIKVLFVGRLSAVKNIAPIIDACESEDRVQSLRIVGAGEEYDFLRSKTAEKTQFVGGLSHDDVLAEMRQADVLVMNSIHEGVPMTVLEAMALSLPVASTDVGGIADVVSFGEGGLKTDGTSESIRGAIVEIAENHACYEERAYAISSKFFYKNVNEAICEVLFEEGRK